MDEFVNIASRCKKKIVSKNNVSYDCLVYENWIVYLEARNSSTVFIIYYDLEDVTRKPFDPKSRVVTGSGITAPGSQAMRSGSAFFFFFSGISGIRLYYFCFHAFRNKDQNFGTARYENGISDENTSVTNLEKGTSSWTERGILGRTSRK